MIRRIAGAVLILTVGLAGCVRDERPADGLVNVRAPGVRVRVGQGGRTSVQAPGVDVQAGREAVRVVTPGDADVERD